MNPLISIIIPFYNSASFLEDAIISIVSQSCDYEAIFIDDGSKDNGFKIVEKYIASNSRIKLIRQRNQGVSRARANGVKVARANGLPFWTPMTCF